MSAPRSGGAAAAERRRRAPITRGDTRTPSPSDAGDRTALVDHRAQNTYDALNRLVSASRTGLELAYTLDGDGNRTAETLNAATTSFDLDLRGYSTVLFDGTRTYLPGTPNLGSEQAGVWRSGLVDLHGSLLATVASGGAVSPLIRYDPYGGARPGSTIPTGIGWAGEWTDAAGLVNLRARAYDPASASTEDPSPMAARGAISGPAAAA